MLPTNVHDDREMLGEVCWMLPNSHVLLEYYLLDTLTSSNEVGIQVIDLHKSYMNVKLLFVVLSEMNTIYQTLA